MPSGWIKGSWCAQESPLSDRTFEILLNYSKSLAYTCNALKGEEWREIMATLPPYFLGNNNNPIWRIYKQLSKTTSKINCQMTAYVMVRMHWGRSKMSLTFFQNFEIFSLPSAHLLCLSSIVCLYIIQND